MKTVSAWKRFMCAMACLYAVFTVAIPPLAEAFTARNLAYGSQGYDVDELQNRLRLIGYYWGPIDGHFGWDTYWAVRTFQYNFRLPVTGLVNMETKIKLANSTKSWHSTRKGQSETGVQSQSSSHGSSSNGGVPNDTPDVVRGISKSNINLMAHVVYGEARGETFRGQVAIAAVILNRFRDPRFPHSIPGIIYQPEAFTCVQDGQVNLQPNAEAFNAVVNALHGWDPALGAVYYFNPRTATSAWIWTRPEILTIGHHIFCR